MDNLTHLRKSRGLNMKKVAEGLEIPYTTYVSYEKGDREPNSKMLIRLAEFFNTSIDYLLGRVDDPELSASAPLSYMESCGDAAKAAYKAMQAIDEENLGSATISTTSKDELQLLSLYRELNAEGQEKLVDHADDLVASGKYLKTDASGLGQDA